MFFYLDCFVERERQILDEMLLWIFRTQAPR